MHSTGTAPTVRDRHSIWPMAFTLFGNETSSSSTGSAFRCSFNLWALKTLLTSSGPGLALPARRKWCLEGAYTSSALGLLNYHAVFGKLLPWQVLCGCSAGSQQPTGTSDHSMTHNAALGLPQHSSVLHFGFYPRNLLPTFSRDLGSTKFLLMRCGCKEGLVHSSFHEWS